MQIIRDAYRAIEALGGNKAVAGRVGINPSAIGNFKARGYFPSAAYLFLSRELAKLGMAPDISLFPEMWKENGGPNGASKAERHRGRKDRPQQQS